ncbi:unnamed protein product [Hydatigera taeniaeformis]|uniref:Uncharacterized protein n=1 Tax=Hydatigena taeniaeformis TaxID=6205 RepID=A0A0R3WQ08_HYDTA|nr:unnamed protein product [Hydatigera taeniaeformis]
MCVQWTGICEKGKLHFNTNSGQVGRRCQKRIKTIKLPSNHQCFTTKGLKNMSIYL